MNDLNNILYFAKIVECGSLSAAADALGVAKSVLSQHLSRLEADLGVRLIQRTTRKLQVTDVGHRYYERCRAVLAEVERASNVIDDVREVPRGRVRVTCPLNFAQVFMAPLLAEFMARHAEVEVVLSISNDDVDLIAEGYDLALRIVPCIRSSSLIVRSFTLNRHLLVASPEFVLRHGRPRTPADFRGLPSVGGALPVAPGGRYQWRLSGLGKTQTVTYHPRLLSEDLFVLKEAVLAGVGMAELPRSVCADELADGRLVHLLPQWQLPDMNLYAVYPSRDGLTLAVRTLIDYLSANLQPFLESVAQGSFRMDVEPRRAPVAKFGT
ncbi:LysR substrate-binding domain-containing protein [Rudaea sp.]|uniref:LysR substrate-binding domain-containing protein n=1 Tax=Rudaea sp. TaxID=2136325 RepID=UPI002ED05F1D